MLKVNQKGKEEIFNAFSTEEHIRIAIFPLIIAHIAYRFADQAIRYAAEHRIEELKPLSRAVKALKQEYEGYLRTKLKVNQVRSIEAQTEQFVQLYQTKFMKLYFSTANGINYQHKEIEYDELRTNAYISMQFIKACVEHEDNMTDFIKVRLGEARKFHLPTLKQLYDCMDAILGDYEIQDIQSTQIAMNIFKQDLENLDFVLDKEIV